MSDKIIKLQEIHSTSNEALIPKSWQIARFDDVCDVTDYVANGSFESLRLNVTYLKNPDYAILIRLKDNTKGWNGEYVYVTEVAYNFLEKSKVFCGDLIISNVGEPGKTFIVPDLRQPMTLGPNAVLVRPKDGIYNKFLNYFYQSDWSADLINQIVTGTAQKKFNKTGLRATYIPIPPFKEQNRIVEKLEELLSDLDAGVAELKAAQKKLGQYRQSLLKAAVEGKLTEQWRNNRYASSPQYLTNQERGTTANDTAANTPLSPRGRGVGGEGATTFGLTHSAWLRDRARELRKAQTPQEQALWQQLRAKRFSGFKFRRQQVIGRYIADFVCFEKKLVIELDGGQHSDTKQADEQRDCWLNAQGFRVLRFWNNQWQSQQVGVLETIWQALHESKPTPPLPNPSPTRGEGLSLAADVDIEGESGSQTDTSFYLDERRAGEAEETGAQLLERILKQRRAHWEAKQLAKFQQQGKTPPKGWQDKYPEPVKPDTSDLQELPEGWVWTSIGQCFEVSVGATPSRKESNYWEGNIPWVSSGEVRFSRITNTKERITEEGLNNSSTKINPVGSVLLGMIGEGKTRGQVAILDIEAANNQNCAAIWVSETEIPSEYVYYWLWSQYEETRRGSSGNNQPALNKSIVERILLPLAPLIELKEIVNQVDTVLNASIEQQKAIEFSLKQSTAQRKNILKAAFSGQLVPQDPSDEPASVLLERIRAERVTQQAGNPPKKRSTKTAS